MKHIPAPIIELFPIDSADKIKAVLAALQAELVASNTDLRTLKNSKALHRMAAAMQCDSWSQFLAKLTRYQFENTLQTQYGLSESYTDAAYQSLNDAIRTSGDGCTVAHNYCRRFNIEPLAITQDVQSAVTPATQDEKPAHYGQDPRQVHQAQTLLAELCEQIEQGESPELYGIGAVFEITFVISSSCSAHLTIDPYSGEIVKGQIREKGFAVGTAEMNVYQRELFAKHFDQEIKDAIRDLQGAS